MRILFAFVLFLAWAPATPAIAPLLAGSVPDQISTDDGPHVLWRGGVADVHWVAGGKHIVKTYAAPFELPLEDLSPMKLKLDGKPYSSAEFEFPEQQRIFAISDVHGVFDVMRNILVANKVVDSKNRWTFGKGRLLILGDVACRGAQVTQSYWFIRALEESARKAGGGVHLVIGNHEVIAMTGDLRYVNPKYMNQPDGMPSLAQQYGAESELGRWLRSRPLMIKMGDKLFLHGGISPSFVAKGLGLATANRGLRLTPKDGQDETNSFLLGASGPLWYRGMVLADQADSITEADLDKVLARFNVKRIVVGHCLVEKVSSLHGGKVLAVDANIQRGGGEGLYIEKGKPYRALPDGSKIEIR